MVRYKKIPKICIRGNRGEYKVAIKDDYGESLFSGQKFKLKTDAQKSARKIKKNFFKGRAKLSC